MVGEDETITFVQKEKETIETKMIKISNTILAVCNKKNRKRVGEKKPFLQSTCV